MANIEPATIASGLADRINEFTGLMTKYFDASDFQLRAMERDANLLQKADAVSAFLSKAMIAHMCGNVEQVERNISAAELIKGDQVAVDITRFICYSNLGFATKALDYLRSSVDIKHSNIVKNAINGVCIAAFQFVGNLMNQAKAAKLELPYPDQMAIMQRGGALLRDRGITDEQCAQVIDAAGEVLRSRNLFWMDRFPSIFVSEENGTVAMRLRVDAPPEDATAMTTETARKLIERDLDRLPFYVHFLGTPT